MNGYEHSVHNGLLRSLIFLCSVSPISFFRFLSSKLQYCSLSIKDVSFLSIRVSTVNFHRVLPREYSQAKIRNQNRSEDKVHLFPIYVIMFYVM